MLKSTLRFYAPSKKQHEQIKEYFKTYPCKSIEYFTDEVGYLIMVMLDNNEDPTYWSFSFLNLVCKKFQVADIEIRTEFIDEA